ncbi:hypothetical protein GCM10007939_15110 [Amylibacter marinus]|uniref:L-asparaginase N-terminal domain-containing protein n=1 Tax=Amylibacter marinus TaxID=1475483 RepID=A0ABQ5VUW1_9RHOB|nr:asparaginase [Amylibacter marinus]GLQ35228.1 hypothetical protein GCM10007939_15110 [Amylibacter marinus]
MKIAVVMTGGTIGKRYNPKTGMVECQGNQLDKLLDGIYQEHLTLTGIDVFAKDSLTFDDRDRAKIAEAVEQAQAGHDGVLVLHGTDTLQHTSDAVAQMIPNPTCPIVFTGAMVPLACAGSDGVQNIAQSLVSFGMLGAGVHCVFHNRTFPAGHFRKCKETMTFIPK